MIYYETSSGIIPAFALNAEQAVNAVSILLPMIFFVAILGASAVFGFRVKEA